jgi:hypothetical protein
MKSCNDCRHYRPDWSMPLHCHEFAKCDRHRPRFASFVSIERKHEPPVGCGESAHFFEPLPLGRSHGVDWERARKIAAAIEALKAIVSSEKKTIADLLEVVVSSSPVLRGAYRKSHRIYADGVEVDEAQNLAPPISPYARKTEIGRFTAAEYLAALTTDYCATRAAE